MILPAKTIAEIKKKSGLSFDKTKDFECLAHDIESSTRRHLGVTTLKRMFGYIDDDRKSYEYSLNTIALYLGYDTWDGYMKAKNYDSFVNYKDDSLYIHSLPLATIIEVKYLNRIVKFKVINHEGQNALAVVGSVNSSLHLGDVLLVYRLKIGECIEAEKLIREAVIGNYRTNAAITSLTILPS